MFSIVYMNYNVEYICQYKLFNPVIQVIVWKNYQTFNLFMAYINVSITANQRTNQDFKLDISHFWVIGLQTFQIYKMNREKYSTYDI